MNKLKSGLLAFLALNFVILIHELGHLLTALSFNLEVEQLSLGFGTSFANFLLPGNIEFHLRLIPLGAFVELHPSVFTQPSFQGLLISAAGPGFNFLLTLLIIYFLLWRRITQGVFYKDNQGTIFYKFEHFPCLYQYLPTGKKFESRPSQETFPLTRYKIPLSQFLLLPFEYLLLPFRKKISLNILNIYFKMPAIENQPVSTSSFQGPIGIFKELMLFASTGWEWLLLASSNISLSLGIFNLLPFFIFDGGKIFSIIIGLIFNLPAGSAHLLLGILIILVGGIFFSFKILTKPKDDL